MLHHGKIVEEACKLKRLQSDASSHPLFKHPSLLIMQRCGSIQHLWKPDKFNIQACCGFRGSRGVAAEALSWSLLDTLCSPLCDFVRQGVLGKNKRRDFFDDLELCEELLCLCLCVSSCESISQRENIFRLGLNKISLSHWQEKRAPDDKLSHN